MDIIEPRRLSELSLEAWREFSRRLKVLAFIGGRVCRIGRGRVKCSAEGVASAEPGGRATWI